MKNLAPLATLNFYSISSLYIYWVDNQNSPSSGHINM